MPVGGADAALSRKELGARRIERYLKLLKNIFTINCLIVVLSGVPSAARLRSFVLLKAESKDRSLVALDSSYRDEALLEFGGAMGRVQG